MISHLGSHATQVLLLENHRRESRIVSLKTRIDLMVANWSGKFISRPDPSPIYSILHSLIFYPEDFPLHILPWHRKVLHSLEELHLLQI